MEHMELVRQLMGGCSCGKCKIVEVESTDGFGGGSVYGCCWDRVERVAPGQFRLAEGDPEAEEAFRVAWGLD